MSPTSDRHTHTQPYWGTHKKSHMSRQTPSHSLTLMRPTHRLETIKYMPSLWHLILFYICEDICALHQKCDHPYQFWKKNWTLILIGQNFSRQLPKIWLAAENFAEIFCQLKFKTCQDTVFRNLFVEGQKKSFSKLPIFRIGAENFVRLNFCNILFYCLSDCQHLSDLISLHCSGRGHPHAR